MFKTYYESAFEIFKNGMLKNIAIRSSSFKKFEDGAFSGNDIQKSKEICKKMDITDKNKRTRIHCRNKHN